MLHHFTSDFRILEVQGYYIILGNDWILSHSPVGHNLKTREFSVTQNGAKLLTFRDENIVDKRITISTKKLFQLLKKRVCSSILVLNTHSVFPADSSTVPKIPSDIAKVL